jgi:hypothetical protein
MNLLELVFILKPNLSCKRQNFLYSTHRLLVIPDALVIRSLVSFQIYYACHRGSDFQS